MMVWPIIRSRRSSANAASRNAARPSGSAPPESRAPSARLAAGNQKQSRIKDRFMGSASSAPPYAASSISVAPLSVEKLTDHNNSSCYGDQLPSPWERATVSVGAVWGLLMKVGPTSNPTPALAGNMGGEGGHGGGTVAVDTGVVVAVMSALASAPALAASS